MWKLALGFNAFVALYFYPEMVNFYSANNFNSDFATAWFVHDAALPLMTAIINTLAILPLIDWKPKKGSE